MLLFCLGGTVIGIPAVWALRQTVEASRGASSPDAAVNSYLMALGYNAEEGLLPILLDDEQQHLLAAWRSYRSAMDSTIPPPAKLDFGSVTVGPIDNDRADVIVHVSAIWWHANGTALSYRSEEHPWRFVTRKDGGWQVAEVSAPRWCGDYVRLDACA
ncbi:hypothetical protein [Paractinoplanes atraurantiacus]|uniref:SnoaL-like domain-containing protein n=1 Tax=Paractinoplanes atraurantiacus TaxID=1036182 RepID=A0A285JFL2_9ACTN|nr:hypothetical protein [Actinoplanes atraurantiacus]SNY58176.1 hypothetical protein SAMN05421748_11925 [Actinoplanes atraurantiacus]